MTESAQKFYDESYKKEGIKAQRNWPNEEFCRFMGRNYFSIPMDKRNNINILEIGCGTGANLRLLSDEGFNGFGIDFSEDAINLIKQNKRISCNVKIGNMLDLQFDNDMFDSLIDVFSTFCLNENDFKVCIDEIYRVLRSGGKFFFYTPCKSSQAFIDYYPSNKIDDSTLSGIKRKSSPFYGNDYPFRFLSETDIPCFFDPKKWKINYLEKLSRTYNNMSEKFDFLVFELIKI